MDISFRDIPGPFPVIFYGHEQKEILRFMQDGEVFIRGEKVDDNKAIYVAIKEFLQGRCDLYRRAIEAESALVRIGKKIVQMTGAEITVCGGEANASHPHDIESLVDDCLTLWRSPPHK